MESVSITSEKLSSLIAQIYDAALDSEQWHNFMEEARRVLGVENSVLMMIDSHNPDRTIISYEGFDPIYTEEILERRETEDYYYLALKQQPKNRVLLGTDIISLEEMHQKPFYHEIARKVNCEWLVGGVIENCTGHSGFITFLRNGKSGSFSYEHKRFIAMLLPHIQKAYFIHQRLAQKESLQQTLEKSDYGVVLLDERSHVLFVNHKAEQYLQEQDGVSLRHGHIKLHNYADQLAVDNGIRGVLGLSDSLESLHETCFAIKRPSGNLPYQVVISPLNARSDVISLMPGGACAIFIHDPNATPAISIDMLRVAYGLTEAEARVCEHLFRCADLDEVTDTLEISRNTAKTHLKRIFSKCQVKSQAELMRNLALGLKGS